MIFFQWASWLAALDLGNLFLQAAE
jgi:hypothetical protein